jgi:hypothetical protein
MAGSGEMPAVRRAADGEYAPLPDLYERRISARSKLASTLAATSWRHRGKAPRAAREVQEKWRQEEG